MQRTGRLRSISDKRNASTRTRHNSTFAVGAASRARKSKIKARNAKRDEKAWRKAYHSVERVAFVKSLDCVGCFATPCINAHIRSAGIGLKETYQRVVPLCKRCHDRQHRLGWTAVFALCSVDEIRVYLRQMADRTEAKWREHLEAA